MKQNVYDAGRPSTLGTWNLALNYPLRLEFETLLFSVASLLDFIMTWRLLTFDDRNDLVWFVERNPIALYFFHGWGFDGLVFFKLSLVVLVASICQFIAHQKIDVARRVLRFSTLAVMTVVVYSTALLVRAHAMGHL